MKISCPGCNGHNIVKNGKTLKKIQKYKCNNPTCNKYFTTNTINKFHKTKIPFYFIINELYQYQKMKEIMGNDFGDGTLRRQINCKYHSLKFHIDYPLNKQLTKKSNEKCGITRQRIYYWRKKYSKYLDDEEIVKEAKNYIIKRRRELSKSFKPECNNPICIFQGQLIWANTKSHKDARKHLKSIYGGKEKVVEMIENNRPLYDYLIKEFRVHLVEGWREGRKEKIINSVIPEEYFKK